MSYIKKREIAVGIAFLLVGLGYLYLTMQIPRKQFIDAAFVPYVLAAIMCVLGVLQLLEVRKISDSASSQTQDTSDYRTVWKTLGLIVAYLLITLPIASHLLARAAVTEGDAVAEGTPEIDATGD